MAKDITLLGANYEDVPAVKLPQTGGGEATFFDLDDVDYAASTEPAGNAIRANGILYGQVDSTSTSTVYTATIAGVESYYDGLTILLRNGVVTSASGFTININGLGGKPVYNNMATGNPITPTNPTRDTTIFNIDYTMLLFYDSDIVEGGGWICYRGYDANTNTIGYQLRSNSSTLPTTDKFYRYRILFTSADGTHWVPSTTSTSTNATAARAVNQRPIDPFGEIVYYGTTTAIEANANVTAAQLWQQYTMTLGYAFNRTGAALTLTYPAPIYIKCAPQSNGSAIIDADTPYVQSLPTTEDGKIYIFLGRAYSATAIEMLMTHPVYYYKDGAIRLWSNAAASSAPVTSVNNKTGAVVLDATDVNAVASGRYTLEVPSTSATYPITGWSKETQSGISGVALTYDNGTLDGDYIFVPDLAGFNTGSQIIISQIPTSVSQLTNDSGFVTSSTAPVRSVSVTQIQASGTEIAQVSVNGTSTSIYAPSGGGAEITTATATLTAAGWNNSTQTVNVTGVTSSNSVIVAAAPASITDYSSAGVYCSAQGNGTLTFTCSTTPTLALTVNVMIIGGG